MCADELPPAERKSFLGFTTLLVSLLHHEFHARIEALKDAYQPFRPDADTRTVVHPSRQERLQARQRLEEELVALAVAANFVQLDTDEFARALGEHSLLKVRLAVDTAVVDKVVCFRRGESRMTREVPAWLGLRRRTVEFTNYARVLVYATFKEAEHLTETDLDRLPFRPGSTIVKLFQNVPRDDLEMVFPNVQVRMRRIDKWLIGLPALISGVAVIVTKLIASVGLLLLLLAFWFGLRDEAPTLNQARLVTIGAGLFAFGGFLVRQVTKFKNRKIQFMKALSENLYFRNLDNDIGVFYHLLDAAEEAEAIEAVLAYHFLHTAGRPLTGPELDRQVEEFFAKRWHTRIDFEVDDGLRKLRELSLLTEDEQGRLAVVPLAEAGRTLDRAWDDAFTYREEAVARPQ